MQSEFQDDEYERSTMPWHEPVVCTLGVIGVVGMMIWGVLASLGVV